MVKETEDYGIFDTEADGLIALVQEHRALDVVEAFPCPRCGSTISVRFYPDGRGFVIQCGGDVLHSTSYQRITAPPDWWPQRVTEITPYIETHR